jgi:hypothetical protein
VVFDGTWSGTTSQGRSLTFTVADNTVTAYKIGIDLPSSGGSCPSGMITSATVSLPIVDNKFSGSLSGSFDSATAAKGSYKWTVSIPTQGCYASGTVEWTASKQ